MEIFLARHGQDEDNKAGILNGQRNSPLTTLGEEQAQSLGEHIKESNLAFAAVYSSPLDRAYKTAQMVSDVAKTPDPQKHELLIERGFGVMTGTPVSEIEKRCAPNILKTDLVVYFLDPEGAETFPNLIQRAQKLLSFLREKHEGEKVLLVSHGDIGKMIYAAFYNIPWKEVLENFHFGNTELLYLSKDSPPEDTHIFSTEQYNH